MTFGKRDVTVTTGVTFPLRPVLLRSPGTDPLCTTTVSAPPSVLVCIGPMDSVDWNNLPVIPLPLSGPGEVPRCDQCKQAGTTETLKRCGGCSTMLYCSKECQKAAWNTHKLVSLHHYHCESSLISRFASIHLLCGHSAQEPLSAASAL